MEQSRLYDAAVEGDTTTLSQLLHKDPYLLDRTNLNGDDKYPLHAAAVLGNEGFVRAILQVKSSYQMCLARDRDGRNPVHLSAMHGKLNILNMLIHHHHELLIQAALEKTDRGGTILHLCVKHNQLEALKLLLHTFTDPEFVSAKNENGMTILHLAIYYNQNQSRRQIIIYLINNSPMVVNIKNANGKTALDLALEQGGIEPEKFIQIKNQKRKLNPLLWQSKIDLEILQCLAKAQALIGRKAVSTLERHTKGREGFKKHRDTIMVVASLIGTMAFQAMVSPPGGVWQENLLEGPNPHKVGEAVMAQTHPESFRQLIRANTIAFVSSLFTIIVLLWGSTSSRIYFIRPLSLVMWLSMAATAMTYALSYVTVAPKSARGRVSSTCEIVIIAIAVGGCPGVVWIYRSYYHVRQGMQDCKGKPSFEFDPAPPI